MANVISCLLEMKKRGIALKKILILEDNPAMLAHMTALVGELDVKSTVFSYDNVKDAYQCAMEYEIDLFLIDIILDRSCPGDSSGLKFVDNIRKVGHYGLTPVIFVTSLQDEKLYTYEKLHCYSFIEKPFDPGRFKKLVGECLSVPDRRKKGKTIYLRKEGIIFAVEREDIVYAECVNHRMNIYTKNKDMLSVSYLTLKGFLEQLDSSDMIQCSRNRIVNKVFVHNVDITNRIIQLKDGLGKVEIGEKYKKDVQDAFQ